MSGGHFDSAEMVNFHLISPWLGRQTFPVILGHACFLHLFKIENLEDDDRQKVLLSGSKNYRTWYDIIKKTVTLYIIVQSR